jgi:magnesium-transporting ATPase (P-type)
VNTEAGVWYGRCTLQRLESCMRYVNLYLIGYAVFVIGVLLALWQANILARIDPIWVAIGLIVAIGVGIMFAVSGGKPAVTSE